MMQMLPLRALGVLGALVLVLSGCGQAVPATQPTPASTGERTPVLAFSELAVGPNRLALGVLEAGTPINDPALAVGMRLFYLDGPDKDKVQSETTAVYRGEGLPFGLYVGYATFEQPGAYGLEITVPRPGQEPQVSRLRLDVLEQSRTPMVGSQAIPSDSLTAADVPELAQLTSDPNPDPYKEQVNFIHVEVYQYPFGESFQAQRRVPAMSEWKLRTEPWTFLVDGEGVIQAKYEGGVTFAELEPALAQLAAGQPVQPRATQ